jgi:hypothetical protein
MGVASYDNHMKGRRKKEKSPNLIYPPGQFLEWEMFVTEAFLFTAVKFFTQNSRTK